MRTRRQWIDLLVASASKTLEGTPCAPAAMLARAPEDREHLAREFRDESGHRRPVDGPFLRALLGLPCEPSPPDAALDVVLWSRLGDGSFSPMDAIEGGEGPLNRQGSAALEVWTERELCSLHALWAHAIARRSQQVASRVLNAATWLLQHVQPDNATNRPWGMGVLIELCHAGVEPGEANLYAETLLHNCTVGRGQPDMLSALVIYDVQSRLLAFEESQRQPWFVAGA